MSGRGGIYSGPGGEQLHGDGQPVGEPQKQQPADHCECPSEGVLNPGMASYYDSESELPFVNHEPGKCKCTNELSLFKCSDGVTRTLCSCCHTSGDKRV